MSIVVRFCYHRGWEMMRMKSIYADKYQQIGLKIAYYRKLRGLTQE